MRGEQSERSLTMAYEKIIAFYDRAEKARDAARALEGSGFSSSDMSLLNRESLTDKDARDGNMWQRLLGRNVSDEDRAIYRRAIDSGGAVLTLRAPDTEVNRAMNILNVHGPMNLNDSARRSASPSTEIGRINAPEEVLHLAEEQIDVGKRLVATGKSRIRRFITEKPVEQQITLHDERCEVARREVTDPKLAKDIDWKDLTIEVTETSEQPVVTKTARIAEEVVIRRRQSEHVETIRDRVRRQQLEVERVADVKPDLKRAA
jgi:uncharacterized protein (TIGR02271 family)